MVIANMSDGMLADVLEGEAWQKIKFKVTDMKLPRKDKSKKSRSGTVAVAGVNGTVLFYYYEFDSNDTSLLKKKKLFRAQFNGNILVYFYINYT